MNRVDPAAEGHGAEADRSLASTGGPPSQCAEGARDRPEAGEPRYTTYPEIAVPPPVHAWNLKPSSEPFPCGGDAIAFRVSTSTCPTTRKGCFRERYGLARGSMLG